MSTSGPSSAVQIPGTGRYLDELHHYTSISALEGIISSNTLWATSYRYLNDATEIIHAKDAILRYITPRIDSFSRQNRKRNRRIGHIVEREGGVIAGSQSAAKFMVDNFYNGLFHSQPPYTIEPFITSFCSHRSDSSYEVENGVLSQWRGYSTDAGVCIVFDAKGLMALLAQESRHFSYHQIGLLDIVYNLGNADMENGLLRGFLSAFQDTLEKIMGEEVSPEINAFIDTFVWAACSLKHRAFQEEREVRIFAVPLREGYRELYAQSGLRSPPPAPTVLVRGDAQVRYLAINQGGLDLKSIVRRVIVGPSRNQEGLLSELAREI